MSAEIAIVCWWWVRPNRPHRPYHPADVLRLYQGVERHLRVPFRFVCMTNRPAELDAAIEAVAFDDSLLELISHYPKLYNFSRDMREIAGPKALFLDLDLSIVGDIGPLLTFDDPIRIAAPFRTRFRQRLFECTGFKPRPRSPYNSSVVLHRTGTLPEVWTEFDQDKATSMRKTMDLAGSDQAWIRYRLGPRLPLFGPVQGVHQYRPYMGPALDRAPRQVRIVYFPGSRR